MKGKGEQGRDEECGYTQRCVKWVGRRAFRVILEGKEL